MLCPICKKPVDEGQRDKPKSVYPFCSERCKLIDLGRWLGGRYQIACEPGDTSSHGPSNEPGVSDSSNTGAPRPRRRPRQ